MLKNILLSREFAITATVFAGLLHGDEAAREMGVIEARLTSGRHVTEYRYARYDNIVRMEDLHVPERGAAPPVNLLDLGTGDLTIFNRHNSTFIEVPAGRLVGRHPDQNFPLPGPAMPVAGSADGKPMGPQIPDMPEMPEMPPMPDLPDIPPGIGPGAGSAPPGGGPGMGNVPGMPPIPQDMGGMGGMAMMPPMPMMPGRPAATGLEKTDETREIHGVPCTKYTMSDPDWGHFEIWAIEGLIPFFLPLQDEPRLRGRRDLRESWPSMLREKGLFPMLAVLKDESGEHELLRFEVTRYDPEAKADVPTQFQVPEDYHRIEPLNF